MSQLGCQYGEDEFQYEVIYLPIKASRDCIDMSYCTNFAICRNITTAHSITSDSPGISRSGNR